MDRSPLKVEIVAADRQVWAGEVVNIIARTTEGDVGILPGHEPLMALLVPGVVELVTADGRSETFAVDGGFISVAHGHVWVLSHQVVPGEEVSLERAEREAAEIRVRRNQGEAEDAEEHHLHILEAQIRAGQKAQRVA